MSGLDKDRKRNQTIAFRMTPEERQELEARIKVTGKPKGIYFIESLLHQEIKIAVGKYQSDRLSLEIRRLREALGNICTEDDETRQILAECKSLIGQLIVLIEGNISELNSDDFRVITPDNENALAGNRTFLSNKSRAFIYSKCRFSISKALSNVNNKGDDGVESGLFHWKQDCG